MSSALNSSEVGQTDLPCAELRSPDQVMRLERMGAASTLR